MKENPKAFIPAWLNNLQLSQAEFRLYCNLAARADTKTGVAFPQSSTIAADCLMAKNTVWKTLQLLTEKRLIQRLGKPFGAANRYRVLIPPIGANQIPIDDEPMSANEIPIDTVTNERKLESSIGANESHQSAQMDSREGITNKGNQLKTTNRDSLLFESDKFGSAWNDWETHRKQLKKPLTDLSIRKQIEALEAMGESTAIEAINHSIKNGWTGIFPPKAAATDHRAAKRENEFKENIKIKVIQ